MHQSYDLLRETNLSNIEALARWLPTRAWYANRLLNLRHAGGALNGLEKWGGEDVWMIFDLMPQICIWNIDYTVLL